MEAKRVVPWVLVVILCLLLFTAAGAAVYLGVRWNSDKKSAASAQTQIKKIERELRQLKAQGPEVEVVEKVIDNTPKVPDWVPLYPGFEWTLPVSASITGMTGNSDAPLDSGVISNRRQDVSNGHEIWPWYRDQLQPQGWECPPSWAGGGAQWVYQCSKGDRIIHVRSSSFGEPGTDARVSGHPDGLYLRVYWRE